MKIYTKKLLSLLLAMTVLSSTLLFQTVAFAEDVTYLDEDFSNFVNTGAAHNAQGVVSVAQEGTGVFQVGANDKALKVSANGEPISILYSKPVKNSGYAVLNYSVYHTTVASGTYHAGLALLAVNGFRYSFWKTNGAELQIADYSAEQNYYDSAALKSYGQLIKAGKWYQHSYVIDVANGKMYAYLDGQLLNPEGSNCYVRDGKEVCGISIENDGNLRYFDDLYIDQFTTLEAAEEAIRVKSILAGEKTNSYSAVALAAYKTSANEQLAALRVNGSDSEALAALKKLGDKMIPTVKHVIYEENFENQTVGSMPASNNEYIYHDGTASVVTAHDVDSSDNYVSIPGTASDRATFVGLVGSAKMVMGNVHALGNNLTWEARVRWNEMPSANYENFLQGTDFNGSKFWTTQVMSDGRVNLYNYNYNSDGTYFPTATTIISSLEVGKWYDLRFEYNHESKLVEAYVDNVYAGAGHTIPDSIIYSEGIDFITSAFDFRNVCSSVSVDNLRFSTSHNVPQNALILNSTYADGNGDPVNKLTEGGQVVSTYVTKNLDKDYFLYTAVYVNDVLTGAKVSSLDEVPVGIPTAVSVDLVVPDGGEVRQFLWRSNLCPVMTDIEHYVAPKEAAKVFVIGDANANTWGSAISDGLNNVTVDNRVTNGETLKNYYQKSMQALLKDMNKGDYLMIQFDLGTGSNFVDPSNNYRAYLNIIIQEAQQKGAIPVLVAPANNAGYANAVKAVGRAFNVPVLTPVENTAQAVLNSLADADISLSAAIK